MKIITLFDRTPSLTAESLLPEALAAFYDGGLVFSSQPNGRPLVIGNFVQTLDGIVSLKIPHQSGGGVISGGNEEDRFIMALLRACADAVMVATGTLMRIPGIFGRRNSFIPPWRSSSSSFAHVWAKVPTPAQWNRQWIWSYQPG
jgi:hypothetical protein